MEKGLTFEEDIKSIKELVQGWIDGYLYELLDNLTLQSLDNSLTQFFNHQNNEFVDDMVVIKEGFLTWNLYNKRDRGIYYEFVVKLYTKRMNYHQGLIR